VGGVRDVRGFYICFILFGLYIVSYILGCIKIEGVLLLSLLEFFLFVCCL
jgi:hypothetical protein